MEFGVTELLQDLEHLGGEKEDLALCPSTGTTSKETRMTFTTSSKISSK